MSDKRKLIVFDFNRTLYDPDRRKLVPRALSVLRVLAKRDFDLYLVSTANPSRVKLIRELGLAKYFKKVIVTTNKSTVFRRMAARNTVLFSESFVVGDRVRSEIKYGNRAGMRTIWFRNGRFADEMPRIKEEKPHAVIQRFPDLLKLIGG